MANEKLIYANALLAKFERIAKKSAYPYFHLDEIADEINEADAVDAVEVVRCKDCKHIETIENSIPYCTWHHSGCGYDDFCSYGERKVDNGQA